MESGLNISIHFDGETNTGQLSCIRTEISLQAVSMVCMVRSPEPLSRTQIDVNADFHAQDSKFSAAAPVFPIVACTTAAEGQRRSSKMKEEIHPEYNPVVFVDGEHEIVTRSTMTSETTREIDGVEHYVVHVDISAFTHPFYTGKQKLMDTEGRVDRFLKRYNLSRDDEEIGEEPPEEEQPDQEELAEAVDEDATDEADDESSDDDN